MPQLEPPHLCALAPEGGGTLVPRGTGGQPVDALTPSPETSWVSTFKLECPSALLDSPAIRARGEHGRSYGHWTASATATTTLVGLPPSGTSHIPAMAGHPATPRRISRPTGVGAFYKAAETRASSGRGRTGSPG